jgi:hypothetical protein
MSPSTFEGPFGTLLVESRVVDERVGFVRRPLSALSVAPHIQTLFIIGDLFASALIWLLGQISLLTDIL